MTSHHRRVFADRYQAGAELAQRLARHGGLANTAILALPRGGVPVAYEVARGLGAPLDVFIVRKLGVPGHSELAMGAIASGGVRVLNERVLSAYGIPAATLERVASEEQAELARRESYYREGRSAVDVAGKAVIVVDDGLATGSTMKAAVEAVRRCGPRKIVVAVPVGAPDTCCDLERIADEVVCAHQPDDFMAVGLWYDDFSQTSDDEVRALLHGVPREAGTR